MSCGIRVMLVMNRKGGSGKSTLCSALASAAVARGETVTVFDTVASKSCLTWMQAGRVAGSWFPLGEVIHTLDVHHVIEAIGQIYEQPGQEHLILIDMVGGGSVGHFARRSRCTRTWERYLARVAAWTPAAFVRPLAWPEHEVVAFPGAQRVGGCAVPGKRCQRGLVVGGELDVGWNGGPGSPLAEKLQED